MGITSFWVKGRHSHPVSLALSGLVGSLVLFPGALRRAIELRPFGAGSTIYQLLLAAPGALLADPAEDAAADFVLKEAPLSTLREATERLPHTAAHRL